MSLLSKAIILVVFITGIIPSNLRSQQLDLEMIYKYRLFYPERVAGIRSMQDGLHYTILDQDKTILKYSYETGRVVDTLFILDWVEQAEISEISSYTLSEDESYILFATELEKIYRYSFLSEYFVYDLVNKVLTPVYSEGKQKLATLSPDGRKVAFVFENNLFIKNIRTSKVSRITNDGLRNHIINGEPDWVYEEEFALKTGYYWSPDSRKIAYYRFDESRVQEYSLIFHKELYPEVFSYKYPKAGEENALVDIYVFDLMKEISVRMETSGETDKYIPRIKWLPNSSEVCITELNRQQNEAILFIANAVDGQSRIFYTETDEKYISEFADDFVSFVDSGKTALIMSEKSGYNHIYRYSIEGELLNPVTQGAWVVDELLGIDEEKGNLYYSSTEVSPLQRHIYKINFDGSEKEKLPSKKGVSSAIFSATFAYYILNWSDANTPPQIALYNENGEQIRMLEDNVNLQNLTSRFNFTKKQFFTVKNNEGTELNCYKILPPKFRSRKKHPLIVFVYGGPESQDVVDKWDRNLAWMQYLAQEGYVVVCTDNRGTDGRGAEFGKSTHLQLGKLETEDQIALAEYMAKQSWIDGKRIGIFGWSYGGYMSLLCLMKGGHIFKSGVAVAPVTNWKYYDTVYTERFMGKPKDNTEGYEENSPINFTDQLTGELLLIHGSEDDNVHFQNTLELMDELIEHNKLFEFYLYPRQNHHMFRGNARPHIYKAVDEFFNSNLK